MTRIRRHFTPDQKAQIVRRHLAGKEPVSKLAEECGVQPSQIHGWVNVVLTQAEQAFARSAGNGRSETAAKDRKIEALQAKLVQKNEVISELMEENVKAKKEFGEL
jgi:transposase-like protein